MRLRSLLRAGAMILLTTALVPVVLAQGDRIWNLVGTVTDMSFHALPGATAAVINRDTGQLRTFPTGEDGKYHINFLWPGAYNVKIAANGYRTIELQGLAVGLEAADAVVLSFSLEAVRPTGRPLSRPN